VWQPFFARCARDRRKLGRVVNRWPESCLARAWLARVTPVSCIYSTDLSPDPYDALDVLAFVLCPVRAFVPTGDAAELAAAAEMIGPAKVEAIRRWHEQIAARALN